MQEIPVVAEIAVKDEIPVRNDGGGKDRFQLVIGVVCGFVVAAILTYFMSWYTYEGKAVAKVNGKAIRYNEFHETLEETNGSEALDFLVQQRLIEEEAKKRGVTVKEEAVSAELKKMMGTSMTEKDLEAFLKSRHLTREALNERIRMQLLVEKLAGEVKAGDKELREFYEQFKDSQYNKEPYDKVKDQVKKDYESFMSSQLIPQTVESLKQKAKITYYW
ncbi:MAG: SurA N-terminal domain-containing protein [Bacillota bacterium]